ncbi:UNVERIFIED_CONTAM: hypothetical protein HHA_216780 [Hammondia hammondi]|eukprot:XP_008886416.1 hypothetical protein HHA_216780 [Hammondia hammondi]
MWRDLFFAAKAKFEQQKQGRLSHNAEREAPSLPTPAALVAQKVGITSPVTSEYSCLTPPSLLLAPTSSSATSSQVTPTCSVAPASASGVLASPAVCAATASSEGSPDAQTSQPLSGGREGVGKPRKLKNAAPSGVSACVEGESSQEPKPKKPRTNRHAAREGACPQQGTEASTQKTAGAKKRPRRPKGASASSAKKDDASALTTTEGGSTSADVFSASSACEKEFHSSHASSVPHQVSAVPPNAPAALSPSTGALTDEASVSASKAPQPPLLSSVHLAHEAAPTKTPKGRAHAAAAWTPTNSPRASGTNKENTNNVPSSQGGSKSLLCSPRSLFREDTLSKFAAILATSQQEREKKTRLLEAASVASAPGTVTDSPGDPVPFLSSQTTPTSQKEVASAETIDSGDAGRGVFSNIEKAPQCLASPLRSSSQHPFSASQNPSSFRNPSSSSFQNLCPFQAVPETSPCLQETTELPARGGREGETKGGVSTDLGPPALSGVRRSAEDGDASAFSSACSRVSCEAASEASRQTTMQLEAKKREVSEPQAATGGSPFAVSGIVFEGSSAASGSASSLPFPCESAAVASHVEIVDDEESLGSDDDADSLGGERDGESEGEEEVKKFIPFRFIRGLWIDVEHEGLAGQEEEDENDNEAQEKPSPRASESRSRGLCFSSLPLLLDFRASVEAAYGGEENLRDPRTLEAAILQASQQSVSSLSSLASPSLGLGPDGANRGTPAGLLAPGGPAGDAGPPGRGGYGFDGGSLQYRPSKLELCVASIEQRLARQRLIANPKDILRGGGGAGGVYYDKDDAFLDDSETFREFGMDPSADFDDQQTVSGAPSESGMDDEDAYDGTSEFVCDNDPTMEDSEPEETDSSAKKGRKLQQDDEKFNPLAWRRFKTSLKQNMTDEAFSVLLSMEEELEALRATDGDDPVPQAIEKIMLKHLRKSWSEQLANRQGPERLVELNWALVNKMGSALHAISRECGVFLVHKTWVRRTLVHNSTVYEYLLLQLFDMIKKSPLFRKDDPAVIQKVQESFEAWQRVGDDSKAPSTSLVCLAVPFAPLLFAGDRIQHLKEAELAKSPLLRIGAVVIDMAVIFHLRRNGLREYVELGLGAESDLQPDQEQHFPQFLRSLLKQAVARRFGPGVRFSLSAAYLKAFVAHLKTRYNVNLYERRARRFRELQFQTVVCRAAVEQTGVCTPGVGLPATGCGVSLSGKGARS